MTKNAVYSRMKSAMFTDQRVGIMNEVICAMRIIKMYTWEDSFHEIVGKVRKYVNTVHFTPIHFVILFSKIDQIKAN